MSTRLANTNLDATFAMMVAVLRTISNYEDCHYENDLSNRERPCSCPPCMAGQAMDVMENWRFIGARSGRMEFNPREAKIVNAWKTLMDDRKLSLILDEEGKQPTPRDWYVATSVVQWLTTNVGQSIMEAAGYKYEEYEKDRAWIKQQDAAREAKDLFNMCAVCHAPDRERCGHWVGKL